MAIDVIIKQKRLLGNKLPLEVILGDSLGYGNYVNDRLDVDELGDTEFVAYCPRCIGRGFSVVWTPKERYRVYLRLPLPTARKEMYEFYYAVKRIAEYWNAELIVDNHRTSLDAFRSFIEETLRFNEKSIVSISDQILCGESNKLTLPCAMWPLTMGREEAEQFRRDPSEFDKWLHDKQSMDVYFACPRFFASADGIFARYFLLSNVPSLLPKEPTIPLGAQDPSGRPLKCDTWTIVLGIQGENRPLCEMEYSKFLKLIPENMTFRYDENLILLPGLSNEKMLDIVRQQTDL